MPVNFSDFKPRVNFVRKFKEYILIFVDVSPHHKTKQEFIFGIDNAEAHLKAGLQLAQNILMPR